MKRGLASAFAVAAIAVSGLAPAASAKTCPTGYTHAVIGGQQKCLHSGEYCSHAEARQYPKYYFKCVLVRGVYRLEHS
jgi:hypothetical protein